MGLKPTTVDIESFAIQPRPEYPPKPLGVSIKYWGKKSKYYSFGHVSNNNSCVKKVVKALKKAYATKDGVLFQNAKFDIDVIETHLGVTPPTWDKIHDTMFLLFLDDPNQMNLGLKESSERLLNWAPEEQDAVHDYLVKNPPEDCIKVSGSKSGNNYYMKYMYYVPGDLAGKYANGDVDRTEALFKLLYKKTIKRGMGAAYDRERRLMPILLEVERRGLPVDLDRLRKDVQDYKEWAVKIDQWVYKRLGVDTPINLNSGQQIFNALYDAGAIDKDKALLTPTGKYQTNKDALLLCVKDLQILNVLAYRNQLNTCLNTFMGPWLETADKSSGLIYTNYNQVKSPKDGKSVGARTGRMSSNPNFQNIPNQFSPLFHHQDTSAGLPKSPLKGLPELPRVRSYIVPFEGHVFIDRDYSQQEPRLLAHFDGGAMMQPYKEDPWLDAHDQAKKKLEERGKFYERKPVKNTNLGIIYGEGIAKLAAQNNMSQSEAKLLKFSILSLYSGIKDLQKELKRRARFEEPFRTWGGRECFCEPPKLIDNQWRTFEYKMVNTLIQGSAADATKEAIIRVYEAFSGHPDWFLLLNVHDQITSSVPEKDAVEAMEIKREAMESIETDVPLLSEGDISFTNWQDLQTYDKKGVVLWGK